MVTGSIKGGIFERLIAKQLSLWLSKGQRNDLLWRSSMSGGRATIGLKKGEKYSAQSGDLSSIHTLSQNFIDTFSVELKHYKELRFKDLVFENKSGLPAWWDQAKSDADKHGKLPFLVAKANYYPTILCLEYRGQAVFWCAEQFKLVKAIFPDYGMYVYLFSDFINSIQPEIARWETPDYL